MQGTDSAPLRLVPVTAACAAAAEAYRAAFPAERERVTWDPRRIPGLGGLEAFPDAAAWIRYTREMAGKISWFLTFREGDPLPVGALTLRHRLEYDDDEGDFASHIGYSVRPDCRRQGIGTAQLRLGLEEARRLGLRRVRLICVSSNRGSRGVIRACGGVYADTIVGEDSGLSVDRWDIALE